MLRRRLSMTCIFVSAFAQIRKVPLMRDPWEHVLFMGLGAYMGDWLGKYETRTAAEIEEILQKRAEKNKNIVSLQSK